MKRARFLIHFFTFFLLFTAFCSFTADAKLKNWKRNCVKCLSIMPAAGTDAITVAIGFKNATTVTVNLLAEDKTIIKSFSASLQKRSKSITIDGIFNLPEGAYTVSVTDQKSGKTYGQQFYKL